jgi:hypothetical protein
MITYLQYKCALAYGIAYETEKEQLGKFVEESEQEGKEFEGSEGDRDSNSCFAHI